MARTLGALWAGASTLERAALIAARARAQSRSDLPTLFDIEKVADGFYGAIARGRAIINSNAAIFENSDHLLIVDAHAAPSAVYALVAQIRREIGDKPVRYVASTHMHGDHTQGLPAYRQINPTLDIIASAKTRALMGELGEARLKSAKESAARSIETLQTRLAAAKEAAERAYFQEMLTQTREFANEMRDVGVELPNVTFDDHLVLHDKSHEIRLLFRGRGHTAGDIVAFCPQKKVIASGDLFHGFFPSMGDAYPRDWPATLRSVGEFEFQSAVGGHGGVQHTPERLGQLRAYLEELNEIVGKAKQSSTPLDRLQQTVTPASLKSLGGGYGEYLGGEVKRHDFRAQLNSQAEVITRGVRDNLASVYRNFDRR
jgi:glyoxylase-like metal-dependent hydrolase (beta-lactamase superfamily II)